MTSLLGDGARGLLRPQVVTKPLNGAREILVFAKGRVNTLVEKIQQLIAPAARGMNTMRLDFIQKAISVIQEHARRARRQKTQLFRRAEPIGPLRQVARTVGNVSSEGGTGLKSAG